MAAEPETATKPAAEQPATRQAREDVTSGPAELPREPQPRWHKNEERRGRDEEKAAERARKEERRAAKREAKESERLTEKQGDKHEETRPRLVGIYTERRKP